MSSDRIETFLKQVEDQPDNLLFRFSLGQALFEDERWEEASEHLETCAIARVDWMVPRILLGKANLALGRKTEARPWLEAALALALEQNHQEPAEELRELLKEARE